MVPAKMRERYSIDGMLSDFIRWVYKSSSDDIVTPGLSGDDDGNRMTTGLSPIISGGYAGSVRITARNLRIIETIGLSMSSWKTLKHRFAISIIGRRDLHFPVCSESYAANGF